MQADQLPVGLEQSGKTAEQGIKAVWLVLVLALGWLGLISVAVYWR